MGYSAPVSPGLLQHFKRAGEGLRGRKAAIRIVEAVLTHFRAEITVLDRSGHGELFRLGLGEGRHGVDGVHIHPVRIHSRTHEMIADKDAVPLLTDPDFNMYVGLLLQALELGRYRAGFKKHKIAAVQP